MAQVVQIPTDLQVLDISLRDNNILHKTTTAEQIRFKRGQILFPVVEKCVVLSHVGCLHVKCCSETMSV